MGRDTDSDVLARSRMLIAASVQLHAWAREVTRKSQVTVDASRTVFARIASRRQQRAVDARRPAAFDGELVAL